MVRSATEVVTAANATKTNEPGWCQKQVVGWYRVNPVGDFDGNGHADAVDGWKSEPAQYRHEGDRNPPAGVPLAWSGGSGGFGHRAVSVGGGFVRSTDALGRGRVGTQRLDWFEKNWGLHYLGWSRTISGVLIPGVILPKPPAKRPKPKTRGEVVDKVIIDLKKARAPKGSERAKHLNAAKAELDKIPYFK